jgi:hypothetical protein
MGPVPNLVFDTSCNGLPGSGMLGLFGSKIERTAISGRIEWFQVKNPLMITVADGVLPLMGLKIYSELVR